MIWAMVILSKRALGWESPNLGRFVERRNAFYEFYTAAHLFVLLHEPAY